MNDLAQQIGISHQQFHKYENGSNRVSAAVLFKIAQILGANLEDFFPKAIEGERLPNVVGLMDSLDPVTRLQVMALVEKLAAKA